MVRRGWPRCVVRQWAGFRAPAAQVWRGPPVAVYATAFVLLRAALRTPGDCSLPVLQPESRGPKLRSHRVRGAHAPGNPVSNPVSHRRASDSSGYAADASPKRLAIRISRLDLRSPPVASRASTRDGGSSGGQTACGSSSPAALARNGWRPRRDGRRQDHLCREGVHHSVADELLRLMASDAPDGNG